MPTPPDGADRRARGKALRKEVKRSSHAGWAPAPDRADPVSLLEEQNRDRVPELVPVRHGRMMASAFAFYRGGARIMAADLATTPRTGLSVQACGDAHLANFGVYASPERELVFDCNDFDETLPGAWEWDVKRLAASVTLAARHNDFGPSDQSILTRSAVRAYREAMDRFAGMHFLDVWYTHVRAAELEQLLARGKQRRQYERRLDKARARTSLRAEEKLTEVVDGERRFRSDPPVLVPVREVEGWEDPDSLRALVDEQLARYRKSMPDEFGYLMRHYRPVDVAVKVVGVGSVGTRCLVLLLAGEDLGDPLLLQIKEAVASVLETAAEPTRYGNQGQRVVEGQHLMQATSDIFLGWTSSDTGHDFYWRQLKDMKGSPDLDVMDPERMRLYTALCGATLARAHAKTGDRIAIAGYLGSGEVFDRAVADFARAYADQAEADYRAFLAAIDSGRLEATPGT